MPIQILSVRFIFIDWYEGDNTYLRDQVQPLFLTVSLSLSINCSTLFALCTLHCCRRLSSCCCCCSAKSTLGFEVVGLWPWNLNVPTATMATAESNDADHVVELIVRDASPPSPAEDSDDAGKDQIAPLLSHPERPKVNIFTASYPRRKPRVIFFSFFLFPFLGIFFFCNFTFFL